MPDLPINQVLCGDAAELMRGLPDASIHAIVTDPPYGLEFMGEEWDSFKPSTASPKWSSGAGFSSPGIGQRQTPWPSHYSTSFFGTANPTCDVCGGRLRGSKKCICEKPKWRVKGKLVDENNLPVFQWSTAKYAVAYYEFTLKWAREALRVLVPGASMLVMGGTRTYHRMACGVEDAGFEVKDTILWCYNSGFPKAQDLGKLIDKRAPRQGMFSNFAKHYGERRNAKGLTHNAVCEHGKFYAEYNHGGASVNWEAGHNVPTLAQWNILQPLLGLSEDFLPLIQRVEAEREIIGKNKHSSPKSAAIPNVYDGQRVVLDVTTPATPLAREWDGWKVGGLKPSYEPVLWAVKPPERSCTENVLKHGVGAINVDACRIPYEGEGDFEIGHHNKQLITEKESAIFGNARSGYGLLNADIAQGRYPANMVRTDRFGDGHDRFYFVPKAERAERWFKCQICDVYQDGTHFRAHITHALHCHDCSIDFPNTDEEKEAHKNHRTESNIVAHPTVKPVALGEFLIKLVTREGQIVLDPFTGLGSFLVAARNLNRQYIGFDNGAEFIEIARRRLATIPPPLEAFA